MAFGAAIFFSNCLVARAGSVDSYKPRPGFSSGNQSPALTSKQDNKLKDKSEIERLVSKMPFIEDDANCILYKFCQKQFGYNSLFLMNSRFRQRLERRNKDLEYKAFNESRRLRKRPPCGALCLEKNKKAKENPKGIQLQTPTPVLGNRG